ncbi:MAG: hypothetical protein ABJN36_10150 [Cyclobacteriaceae bacterium]
MKRHLFTAVFVLGMFFAHSQDLRIMNLDINDDGKVSFTALVRSHHSSRETYELKVYTSADNYAKPLDLNLKTLKVDAPLDVNFDGMTKIGNFKGSIQFKFVAEATAFPVQVKIVGDKFKRGKKMTVSWTDYHESGWYDIEMYRGGTLFKSMVKNHRGTSYSVDLPKKMPKGEYEVRVTPTNDPNFYSEDQSVSVKGGKGGLVFVTLLAAGGGGAYVFLGGGGDDPGGDTDTNSLPDPPTPGGS